MAIRLRQADFLRRHRGNVIRSPMSLGEIAKAFVQQVESYAKENQIPIVQFECDEGKWDFRPQFEEDDVAQRYRPRFDKSQGMAWPPEGEIFIGDFEGVNKQLDLLIEASHVAQTT